MNAFELNFDEAGAVTVSGPLGRGAASVHKYSLAEEEFSTWDGMQTGPALADLVDIAQAVYVADRLCIRGDTPRLPRWTRRIHIDVPVRDWSRWQDPDLQALLTDTLAYFTHDQWEFTTRPMRLGRRVGRQLSLLPPEMQAERVSLFSGGLDSLAGVGVGLARSSHKHILFGVTTSKRVSAVQGQLAAGVRRAYPHAITPDPVRIGFGRRSQRAEQWEEKSQRSRGFVFMVLGAAAAVISQASELLIHENGVGAINLPCSPGQLSYQLTRSTHPIGVSMVSRLVRFVCGAPLAIRLPALFSTKAEICMELAGTSIGHFVSDTVSCDGFPQRVPETPQCGLCTSCLMRRQALYCASLPDPDEKYRYNLFGTLSSLGPGKLYPLKATFMQVHRLERCLRNGGFTQLAAEFPEVLEASLCIDYESGFFEWPENRIERLYNSYVAEWRSMPIDIPRLEVAHG